LIFDPERLSSGTFVDIHPGEATELDIAIRIDPDPEYYGWNNDTYFISTPSRNPEWKLDQGRYLVRVSVRSLAQECTEVFRLINNLPRSDTRLEAATDADRQAIAAHS
jgi:hypothetical protein